MMDNNHMKKVKRNDEAVWRVIDGEVVVLLPQEQALHALTGCGSRVWELIEGETTISEIVKRICAEYEVEPQRAREEITAYVHELVHKKLVEIIPTSVTEAIR
jgi:hypothetical protein